MIVLLENGAELNKEEGRTAGKKIGEFRCRSISD